MPGTRVFQLDARDWDDDVASVADLGERFAALVAGTPPRGPVTVIGWSWGGLIGWELASCLQRRGTDVARVILIDTLFGVVPSCFAISDSEYPAILKPHISRVS